MRRLGSVEILGVSGSRTESRSLTPQKARGFGMTIMRGLEKRQDVNRARRLLDSQSYFIAVLGQEPVSYTVLTEARKLKAGGRKWMPRRALQGSAIEIQAIVAVLPARGTSGSPYFTY